MNLSTNHAMLLTKRNALLMPFLLASFSLFAQLMDVYCPGNNQPVVVRLFDQGNVRTITIPDWAENPVVKVQGADKISNLDLSFLLDRNESATTGLKDDQPVLYDPGIPVEGDLPSAADWSKDGSLFAFVYQHSDNVSFYDATTCEVLATVQVGRQPVALRLGPEHAYICCNEGQEVTVVSLVDFTVTNTIRVDGTPCQVEVNPEETIAYIACDHMLQGKIMAVDLKTNEVLFESFYSRIALYGFSGDIGRCLYNYVKFKLSPDGSKFIGRLKSSGKPAVFNATSGEMEKVFQFGPLDGAGFSPSGDTIYIYSHLPDSLLMYQINTSDYSVIDSIKAFATIDLDIVDYSDLAISKNGSKVVAGDQFNNRICLFNFDTHSYQSIEEYLLLTDSPFQSSSDGEYAITCTLQQLKFIHFESGQVYTTYSTGEQMGLPICVSPKENRLMDANLPFYILDGNGNESIFSINFKNIDNITIDTTLICGEAPEGDVPEHSVISIDGEKILSPNNLSHNLSVIDLDEHTVDTIVNIDDMTGIIPVPGSDLALVYGNEAHRTQIISLSNYEIIKEFNIGHVGNAFVTSDGLSAYLIVYEGNSTTHTTKIKIDGANSSIEKIVTIGGARCEYVFLGLGITISTTAALSPDDQYLLMGSEDPVLGPVVNVIDAGTLELLKAVRVLEICNYDYAFTEDSKRVVASGNNTFLPIIYLDRENSYLENYIHINNKSFSADFNKVDRLFYVLDQYNYLYKVDPYTGDTVESINTGDDHNWMVRIDQMGNPMVLALYSLYYRGEIYPVPGVNSELIYDRDHNLFLSPVPGPDMICYIDPLQVGIQYFKTGKEVQVSIFPNPAEDMIVIKSSEEINRVKIYTILGADVYSGEFKGRTAEIPVNNLSPGVYMAEITTKTGNFSKKIMIR